MIDEARMPPFIPREISVVAIDLDNTLAEGTWPSPEVGEPISQGIELLKFYRSIGFEIVIHTARPQSHAFRIWQWLRDHGLDALVYDVVCGKPRADLYIDDKAWNPWRVL